MMQKGPSNRFESTTTLIVNFWGRLVTPAASITDITNYRQAQLSAAISLIILVVDVMGALGSGLARGFGYYTNNVLLIQSIALLAAYVLTRTRRYRLGALLLTISFSALAYALILANPQLEVGRVSGSIYTSIPFALVIGSALLSLWQLFFLSIINTALIMLLPSFIKLYPYQQAGSDAGITFSIGLLLIIVVAYRNSTEHQRVAQIQKNNQELNETNQELKEARESLEVRVQERTLQLQERGTELEKVSSHMAKRADQLQAVAQVGRAITSVQSLEELLPYVTTVTCEQFGFYHVGIFLLDKDKEYAILSAANSSGGKRMLERSHKLKVGQVGIVGYVASVGRPRIALDTGADAIFFDNPDLPNTHSEIALPLKSGSKIIGVLDVQSEEPDAFGQEDVELLTILADQVSLAIQNSQRFEETQKAMAEAETLSKQYLRREWKGIVDEAKSPGYQFSNKKINPLDAIVVTPGVLQATQSGQTSMVQEKSERRMAVPIKLRGQVIGVMHLQSVSQRSWEKDVINLTQAIADRVALAVENARLLESSQNQAARERTVGEITSKIGASVNLRNVLQTAVEELGRILPGSDVVIQIESAKSKE